MNLCHTISGCVLVATMQGHSLLLFFSNGEEVVRRVHGENPGAEREWRDTPPLDRLSARDRWETEETESPIFHAAKNDEIPAGGHEKMPLKV